MEQGEAYERSPWQVSLKKIKGGGGLGGVQEEEHRPDPSERRDLSQALLVVFSHWTDLVDFFSFSSD